MRGDKSFAYDLFVPHRRVSSRVVLLLRSTERKRSRPRFVDLQSPIDIPGLTRVLRGACREYENYSLPRGICRVALCVKDGALGVAAILLVVKVGGGPGQVCRPFKSSGSVLPGRPAVTAPYLGLRLCYRAPGWPYLQAMRGARACVHLLGRPRGPKCVTERFCRVGRP